MSKIKVQFSAIAVKNLQPAAGNFEDSLSLGTGGDGGVSGVSG